MDDDDLMEELIEVFGEDAYQYLGAAEEAATANDSEALHQAVHSLKGLVGAYAAKPAFELTAEVDGHAREGEVERATELLPVLRKEIDRLKEALNDFRRTFRKSG